MEPTPTEKRIATNIARSYNLPEKLDYNKVLSDLNEKLDKAVITEELHTKAVEQLDTLVEKSNEYDFFERVGEKGKQSYNFDEKKSLNIEKSGEGSRGGKIVGHTKSGKPIYSHEMREYRDNHMKHLDSSTRKLIDNHEDYHSHVQPNKFGGLELEIKHKEKGHTANVRPVDKKSKLYEKFKDEN